MRTNLNRLTSHLGMALCLAGFVAVFLGWNGAATWDYVPAQFPYLISGGVAGLCLVVIGSALLVVQNQRADRARLEAAIDRLVQATERQGAQALAGADSADMVLAGEDSYHRQDCHLPESSDRTHLIRLSEARTRNLTACRICQPVGFEQRQLAGHG
ncbi:hypothetical protein H0B56_11090 [Haloechinothrix sp. YIM 98757]|uniref:Uncharacterized protein n=1 Tax=Haloechinothrix aidingensis TaxID=2752311 RepID=A0A838A936_9PSEU|nr:hypothetical protein [Haloechinothrix aidingensis]MBA0126085.1 hypothetical protein [Haloechinothrix aidingensis]